MKLLYVGDIYGNPGRTAAAHFIPKIKEEYNIDIVIANGENSAGGVGITEKTYQEMMDAGIDILTSGNHIWDKKEIFDFIDKYPNLIRPANYPKGTPGIGYNIFEKNGVRFAVINLLGRTFMPPIDSPFIKVDEILAELEGKTDIIFLDFHAETTSEKMAMGWYLDGKITALVGTHTHIQTADERILPSQTAYITDLGMVGAWNSILGVDKDIVIQQFRTGLPVRFKPATGEKVFCAVIIEFDEKSGKAISIERIKEILQ